MTARQTGFKWKTPPRFIANNLDSYGVKVIKAALLVGEKNGQAMQNYARRNAPWTDRTGNARAGLFYVVKQEPGRVTIYLCHSVDYGVYLELAHGGRLEIIWPTILLAIERIRKDLTAAIGGRQLRKGASYRG